MWELRKECLVLLRDLCYATPLLSEQLCSQRSFIVFLFSLMRNQNTFDEAVGLTEEVLAFRGEIFNLSLVPDFEGLINSFSKRQMAFFCRVLALVVFEPEDRPSEELKITKAADLLTARREQALSPAVKNTDRNHAVLLGIEELLPRMVKLVLVHAVPMSRWADEIIQHLPTAHHYDLFNILGVEDSNDWDDIPPVPGIQHTLYTHACTSHSHILSLRPGANIRNHPFMRSHVDLLACSVLVLPQQFCVCIISFVTPPSEKCEWG